MMAQQNSTIIPAGERLPLDAMRSTRVNTLPADFRAAFVALATYLDHRCPIAQVDASAGALEDLATLFEQAAADGVSVRDVVGHDPADVAEDLLDNYMPTPRDAAARVDLARAIDAIVAGRMSHG